MTRSPDKPLVTFKGPFTRCESHGERVIADGAGIRALRSPREAWPSLGHRSFVTLAPPPWARATAPVAPPQSDPPVLRLVASTPDGDAPVRSAAVVHVFPGR